MVVMLLMRVLCQFKKCKCIELYIYGSYIEIEVCPYNLLVELE